MKKTNKILAILLTLACALAVFAGCSANSSSSSSSGSADASGSDSSGSSSQSEAVSSINHSMVTTDTTQSDTGLSVTYPEASKMDDETVQTAVNQLLKDTALAAADRFDLTEAGASLAVENTLSYINGSCMSVIFEGEYTSDSQEKPTSLYYALNLDLSTGEVLDLSGLVDPDELAASILAGGYTLSTASDDELYDGQKTYLESLTAEELSALLKDANTFTDGGMPQASIAFDEDNLIISLQVSQELGGHMELTVPMDIPSQVTA